MRQLACRVHLGVGRCIAISATFGTFGVKSTGINKKAEKILFFSASLRLYKRLLANLLWLWLSPFYTEVSFTFSSALFSGITILYSTLSSVSLCSSFGSKPAVFIMDTAFVMLFVKMRISFMHILGLLFFFVGGGRVQCRLQHLVQLHRSHAALSGWAEHLDLI